MIGSFKYLIIIIIIIIINLNFYGSNFVDKGITLIRPRLLRPF